MHVWIACACGCMWKLPCPAWKGRPKHVPVGNSRHYTFPVELYSRPTLAAVPVVLPARTWGHYRSLHGVISPGLLAGHDKRALEATSHIDTCAALMMRQTAPTGPWWALLLLVLGSVAAR